MRLTKPVIILMWPVLVDILQLVSTYLCTSLCFPLTDSFSNAATRTHLQLELLLPSLRLSLFIKAAESISKPGSSVMHECPVNVLSLIMPN